MRDTAGSLDTNVLLRLLLKDVPEQHEAVEALFKQANGAFEVADAALIEIVFVLERHYRFTRAAILDDVSDLVSLPQLRCNQVLIKRALQLFVAHPALSFEDCCLSVYAELQDATPLWTFDKKLASQAPDARLVPVGEQGGGVR